MSNFESMFQMDRPCPDNLCNYTYHAKKKPFKCPICDAHKGEKRIFFVSNVCVLKSICVDLLMHIWTSLSEELSPDLEKVFNVPRILTYKMFLKYLYWKLTL